MPHHAGRVPAIDAARQCLQICRDLSKRYLHNVYNWTFCCHWVLLHAPLTAFTGIFYSIIENPWNTEEDVRLLEDFVASLEPARRLSEPIDKFYRLCLAFINVAHAFARTKRQQQHHYVNDAVVGIARHANTVQVHENAYVQSTPVAGGLNAQPEVHHNLGTGATINGTLVHDLQQQQLLDVTNNLQDWYSGNASLYGMLEQDFSDPGFGFFHDGMGQD